jgi:hypothetical protein
MLLNSVCCLQRQETIAKFLRFILCAETLLVVPRNNIYRIYHRDGLRNALHKQKLQIRVANLNNF